MKTDDINTTMNVQGAFELLIESLEEEVNVLSARGYWWFCLPRVASCNPGLWNLAPAG